MFPIVDALMQKLGLLGVTVASVVTIIALVFSSAILWAIGLLVPVAFGLVGVLLIYCLHCMEFEIKDNKWLVALPFVFFGVGFIADKTGVLSVQAFSVESALGEAQLMTFLIVIIALLVGVAWWVSRD